MFWDLHWFQGLQRFWWRQGQMGSNLGEWWLEFNKHVSVEELRCLHFWMLWRLVRFYARWLQSGKKWQCPPGMVVHFFGSHGNACYESSIPWTSSTLRNLARSGLGPWNGHHHGRWECCGLSSVIQTVLHHPLVVNMQCRKLWSWLQKFVEAQTISKSESRHVKECNRTQLVVKSCLLLKFSSVWGAPCNNRPSERFWPANSNLQQSQSRPSSTSGAESDGARRQGTSLQRGGSAARREGVDAPLINYSDYPTTTCLGFVGICDLIYRGTTTKSSKFGPF